MRSFLTLTAIASLSAALLTASSRDALACGGCFAPPAVTPDRAQIVTDHRMVLALSQRQTTLWDQIRYTGAPEDFVWVLPVANAATLQIGLADNAFIDALDTYTAPFVTADLPECWQRFQPGPRVVDSGLGFGCGTSGGGFGMMPGVESTRVGRDGEAVVGPYAVNVISTESGGARLDGWLRAQGYQVPASTQSAIDHYVDLQFDFIVLRLRPGAGVKQMQPVRITTRGYMPMLPLRMIAAGIGDKVGLQLTVISSGRVEAQGFTNATIDERALTYDFRARQSNYRALFDDALRRRIGRTWVTESVQNLVPDQLVYGSSGPPAMPPPIVMTVDGSSGEDARSADDAHMSGDASANADGADSEDGAVLVLGDADQDGSDSALVWDAGDALGDDVLSLHDGSFAEDGSAMMLLDASGTDAGMSMMPWEAYIDRRYAFAGLDGRAVITRMRAELRYADLDGDLILDGASGPLIPIEYTARTRLNPPPCPTVNSCAVVGAGAPLALEALGVVSVVMLVRRRRRARRDGAPAR